MGFKDGTNNVRAEDGAAMSRYVWAGSEAPAWMRGGTYMVCRRIQILLSTWDGSALHEQQHTFGRRKSTGAPLSGVHEYDPVDLKAVGPDGQPVIAMDAHIRLAAPASNGGEAMLRRGYSFATEADPQTGLVDAGLFFICFQRDPGRQFVRIQRQLDGHDHLSSTRCTRAVRCSRCRREQSGAATSGRGSSGSRQQSWAFAAYRGDGLRRHRDPPADYCGVCHVLHGVMS